MTIRTSVLAAAVAFGFVFSGSANAHDYSKDLEDMTDEELSDVFEEVTDGLEEVRESRVEVKEEAADEDAGKIERTALGIADKALGVAETALEDVLEEIEEEQKSRT
jgi:VIT1/CCC1 family predicted Fe2+/Mn2+ transporter